MNARKIHCAILVALAAQAISATPARAQLTWDGGNGIWATSGTNADRWNVGQFWSQGSSGTFPTGSGATSVTLGEHIQASTVTINSLGGNIYGFELDGFNLTLTGAFSTGHQSNVIRNSHATTATITATTFGNYTYDGNLNLTKIGGGTWNRSSVPNTFTGKLTIQDGTVLVTHNDALGAPSAVVRLEGPGVLRLDPFSGTSATYARNIEFAPNTTSPGGISIGDNAITLSGNLSGSGILRRIGGGTGGTLILSGDNSNFTGNIVFGAVTGTIIAASDTAFGTGTSAIVMQVGGSSGMTIGFQGGVNVGAKPITINQSLGAAGNGQIHNFGGDNTFAGDIAMAGGGSTGSPGLRTFGAEAGSSLNLTGEITGPTGQYFVKTGPGAIELSTNNSYRGRTIIRDGTLLIGTDAPKGTGNSTIGNENIGALGNTNSTGTPNSTDNRSHVWLGDNISPASTPASANLALLITGPFEVERPLTVWNHNPSGTTTIGGTNTSGVAVFSGEIDLQRSVILSSAPGGEVHFRPAASNAFGQTPGTGVISGPHGVTVDGGGTVVFGANQTYTGATDVAAGTLLIGPTGSLTPGGGTVTVMDGATLGGTGTINRHVDVLSGGTHAVGMSIGTQTVASENWFGGSTFEVEVDVFPGQGGTAGVNWDLLQVTGTLGILADAVDPVSIKLVSLDGGGNPGLADFDPSDPGSMLIASAGSLSGFDPAAFLVDTSMFENDLMGGTFDVSAIGGDVFLNFTPGLTSIVPEPASLILWGILLAALAGWRALRRPHKVMGQSL